MNYEPVLTALARQYYEYRMPDAFIWGMHFSIFHSNKIYSLPQIAQKNAD
jgi:hypothetical protein